MRITCSRSMSAMAAASSLSKMDSTSGILRCRRSSSVLRSGGGGECGGVGVDSSSGRWPGCCEGGGGGGGLCAGVSVGVADILLAALKRPSALMMKFSFQFIFSGSTLQNDHENIFSIISEVQWIFTMRGANQKSVNKTYSLNKFVS